MRTKATISSFVLVLVLYFVYGWGLVPLVLPNPNNSSGILSSHTSSNHIRAEIEPFVDLLPEGGWERNPDENIYSLRFGQNIILFGKDRHDGRFLYLEPCTVLILPEDVEYRGDEETREQIQQAVIFRADRAEIEFDRDFDISKIQSLEINAGRLLGKVTVESGTRDSGRHDDFFLETGDISITEGLTKIGAPGDVRFNLGLHSGRGTGLTLELQPQASRGLHSARFNRLTELRLVFPEDTPNTPATTIDVRCQRGFQFVANPAEPGWIASFFQNVEMVRNNPDNSIDHLNAAESVHLTLAQVNQVATSAAGSKASQFDGLEPTLFVAHGSAGQGTQPAVPARLSVAQDGGAILVGDEIFLDLRRKFLKLSTRKGVGASPHVEMFLADQYRIRSEHSVQYTLGQNDAFGMFASEGKGDLTGKVGEGAAAKDIYLTWNEMQMAPHPGIRDHIVLKLSKGITARMTGFGTMTADSLDLYCDFVPSNQSVSTLPGIGNQKSNLLLDHAVVKENVLFKTASGTCQVRQLTIFFVNVTADGRELHSRWMPQMLTSNPPVAPSMTLGRPIPATSQPIRQVQHLQPLTTQHALTPMQSLPLYQPPAVSVPNPAPAYGSRMTNPLPQSPRPATGFVETQNLLGMQSSPNDGRFEMTGDQMRMRVRMQNGQSLADVIAIEGNVQLQEKPTNNVPNAGIEIAGSIVTIWNPADPATKINILGHPTGGDAIFKGKGVELRAGELNISRPDNKFWSEVPGRLIANTAQISAPGIPSGNTDSQLIVEWNKEMVCDGSVLQFVGLPGQGNRVQVLHQTQTLWCNILEVQLNRRVMFFEDQSTVEPKPVEIRFAHDVIVRRQQFDAQGRRRSIEFAEFAHLHYDVENNYFRAAGPGKISSIFLGSGQGFDRVNQNNGESLNGLVVWFLNDMQGAMLGNNRRVDIRGKVDTAYYPAAGWEDVIARENIAAARRTGYIMECERLEIVEVPDPLNLSQSSMELTASTNATIDGRGMFSSAQRIMYNQAKSTVQLDGNVRLRTTVQGQPVDYPETESIRYNIETNAVEVLRTQGLIL